MSRLHRQKLRLRAMQREDGIIEPDADEIDREALETEGSVHSHLLNDETETEEAAPDEAEAPAAPRKSTKRKKAKAKRR